MRVFERIDEVAPRRPVSPRDARRDLLCERLAARLPDWTFEVPAGGMSLSVRIADADAVAFTRLAVGYGVIVRAGPGASPDGGFRDHIRIAYGGRADRSSKGSSGSPRPGRPTPRPPRVDRASVAISV